MFFIHFRKQEAAKDDDKEEMRKILGIIRSETKTAIRILRLTNRNPRPSWNLAILKWPITRNTWESGATGREIPRAARQTRRQQASAGVMSWTRGENCSFIGHSWSGNEAKMARLSDRGQVFNEQNGVVSGPSTREHWPGFGRLYTLKEFSPSLR